MAQYDLVVRGGTVVTASETFLADVGIVEGRITALGERLDAGAQDIDARGLLVMPGGVDSHCHIEQPKRGGLRNAESFDTGTRSALAGGTTSVICFSPQFRGEPIGTVLEEYHRLARRARCDYSFHLLISDPTDQVLEQELPRLIESGLRSLKIFMTTESSALDDGQILRLLACAKRHGALVVFHAENYAAIKWLTQRLLDAGLTAPKYHAWSKPAVVEREACHRAIALAEIVDTPIQIFHVSADEVAEEIARARRRGLKVHGETCPQYLVLSDEDLDRPGFEGAKYVFSPAARPKREQAALWRHIADGTLDIVSSDHAPWNYDDAAGKKAHGETAAFNQIPNGVPGLAARLPLLFEEGVRGGHITLNQFVAITATNPARLFGLHPRKGTIAIGADADLVLWDADRTVRLDNAMMQHAVDYTPFEGRTVRGWPRTVLLRGQVAMHEGEVRSQPGDGRFLPRGPYDMLKPSGRLPTPFDPVAGTVRAAREEG